MGIARISPSIRMGTRDTYAPQGRHIMTSSDHVFVESLTAREQQIADAVVRGLSNREIAREFGISAETVKHHLASIYGKPALPGP